MHAKLKLTLDALRVRAFATTPLPRREGDEADDECGECSVLTQCSDWTRCTRCTWPSCIHTADDGPDCLPGTVA